MTNDIKLDTKFFTTERRELEEYLQFIGARYQLYSFEHPADRRLYIGIKFLDEKQQQDIFALTIFQQKRLEDFYIEYKIKAYNLSKMQERLLRDDINGRQKKT